MSPEKRFLMNSCGTEAEQEVEGIACRNRTEREKAEELRQSIFNLQDAAMSRLWCANVIDIEMTLSNVCKAILKDTTVSKDVLGLRAEALEKFGEIFKGGNLPYRREYSLCLEEAKVYENEEEDDST